MTTDTLLQFLTLFVLLALAVYRGAFMLVFEEGLFGVTARIRNAAGIYIGKESILNDFGQQVTIQRPVANNWIGKGLTCFNCTSIWLASVAAVPLVIAYPLPDWNIGFAWVLYVLALSGAAMRLNGG